MDQIITKSETPPDPRTRDFGEYSQSEAEKIRELVCSKELIKTGLVFRKKNGQEHADLNIEEHLEELSEIFQSRVETSYLCENCQPLGLEFFHLLEVPHTSPLFFKHAHITTGVVIGDISQRQDGCSMCKLLASSFQDSGMLNLRSLYLAKTTPEMRTLGLLVIPADTIPRTVLEGFSSKRELQAYRERRRQIGILLPCRRNDERNLLLPRARLSGPQVAEFGTLVAWMVHCRTDHTACRTSHHQLESLQMIHCRTRKVVPAPENCSYACLSYVWGAQAAHAELEMGLQPGSLPVLFEDAITVTAKLGLDYLWIDRLCIPQHLPAQKQHQIRKMDKIYARAEVTIIASCSSDSTVGLAGVGSNTRTGQACAKVGKTVFTSVNNRHCDLIRQSKWNTRGWTYQEALLSRRKLVFTEESVYFQGKACSSLESIDIDPNLGEPLQLTRSVFSGCPTTSHGHEIWDLIEEYTDRQLTYDTDILNAMLGILQRFSTAFPKFDHVLGIPLARSKAKMRRQNYSDSFAEGLCWESDANSIRRFGFPSWSWTGWTGPSQFKEGIDFSMFRTQSALENIAFTTQTGHHISLDEFIATPAEERPSITHALHVKAMMTPLSLRADVDDPGYLWVYLTGLESRNVRTRLEHPPGFQLSGRHFYGMITSIQTMRDDSIHCPMLLIESSDNTFTRVGHIPLMDIASFKSNTSEYMSDGIIMEKEVNLSFRLRNMVVRELRVSVRKQLWEWKFEYRDVDLH